MNSPRYYYADAMNQAVGPFTVEELNVMLKTSILSGTTQVCPEGGSEWTTISSILSLSRKGNRSAYQEVAEKVGLVPDWSKKRNLLQLLITASFVLISAVWGAVIGGVNSAVFFGFIGLVAGVLVSGTVLMVMGWKK